MRSRIGYLRCAGTSLVALRLTNPTKHAPASNLYEREERLPFGSRSATVTQTARSHHGELSFSAKASFERAQRALERATSAVACEDYDFAESLLRRFLAPDAGTQARALLLQADVAAARGQYRARLAIVQDACSLLSRDARAHRSILEQAELAVAAGTRDLLQPELLVARISLRRRSSGMLRAAAWAHAAAGDVVAAAKVLRDADCIAANAIQRLHAIVDRATLDIFARGSQTLARDCWSRSVEELATAVDWNGASPGDLAALPLAVQILTELGRFEPAMRLLRYVDSCRLSSYDRALVAYVTEASALLAVGSSQTGARDVVSQAYAELDRIGFAWRAARMALLASQIDRTCCWRERANMHLARCAGLGSPRLLALGNFTYRQRQVYALMNDGASTFAISQQLDISYNTARNHIKTVNRKLQRKTAYQPPEAPPPPNPPPPAENPPKPPPPKPPPPNPPKNIGPPQNMLP